jgi:hypothetical protein
MVAIPGALTWVAYKTEVRIARPAFPVLSIHLGYEESYLTITQGKYELRGKRRGDTISEW